ncbi:MAG: hypothetical protein J6O04_12035 [Selenomonadaceae bacterium]|nr:hypothetical protein [Selenomonadaceae bacterium]
MWFFLLAKKKLELRHFKEKESEKVDYMIYAMKILEGRKLSLGAYKLDKP